MAFSSRRRRATSSTSTSALKGGVGARFCLATVRGWSSTGSIVRRPSTYGIIRIVTVTGLRVCKELIPTERDWVIWVDLEHPVPRPGILLDSALGTFDVENVLKERMHV